MIKLGALGDFILAEAAFKAIRTHHPRERLILLTTPTFEKLAQKLGYFDSVFALPRFSFFQWKGWRKLLSWFRSLGVSRVYDLQMVNRTKIYYHAFKCVKKKPFEWVGHIKTSPYCLEDAYFKNHPSERFHRLLEKVGIARLPDLDITRLSEAIEVPSLEEPYVLVVPNASNAFGGAKKWSLEKYKTLLTWLTSKGYQAVIVGGFADDHSTLSVNSNIHDLTGKTSFGQIIGLAQKADFALGSDTGPIHMAAASLCPVFVLFSDKALPAKQVGARGILYHHKTVEDLAFLEPSEVIKDIESFIGKVKSLKRENS